MKNSILTAIVLFMSAQIFAQPASLATEPDSFAVYVNGKKMAQYITRIGQTENDCTLKKMGLNKIKTIVIEVKGPSAGNARYARTLEIKGDSAGSITETKDKPGYFDISKTYVKKNLAAGKKVSLTLVLNPANPLMMMPSKIIFLGNLMMK
jgi:acetaldehyde dehydrogenase (acetylating)